MKDLHYQPTEIETSNLKKKYNRPIITFFELSQEDRLRYTQEKLNTINFKVENNQYTKNLTPQERMVLTKYLIINQDSVIII